MNRPAERLAGIERDAGASATTRVCICGSSSRARSQAHRHSAQNTHRMKHQAGLCGVPSARERVPHLDRIEQQHQDDGSRRTG